MAARKSDRHRAASHMSRFDLFSMCASRGMLCMRYNSHLGLAPISWTGGYATFWLA